MLSRACLLLTFAAWPVFCADWNPRLAAQYLDSRQKLWVAWPRALKSGVPCVSCHTSIPYLLARPALRRQLDEGARTPYETALLDGVRTRISKSSTPDLSPDLKKSPLAEQLSGEHAVIASLLLARDDVEAGREMSVEAEQAFDRMWTTQIRSGPAKGAWQWTEVDLDPWETSDSVFYGAALAAVATGSAPGDYQSRPNIRENVTDLTAYLRGAQTTQPLHNRLALLWAARRLRGCLPEADQRAILDEVRQKQAADGGWTLESLGAWRKHTDAPAAQGSNSYATAVVAFTLEKAGVGRTDRSLVRALEWLAARQDAQSGYWDGQSMNKHYPADSMQIQFMRDAATGYAAAALLDGQQR